MYIIIVTLFALGFNIPKFAEFEVREMQYKKGYFLRYSISSMNLTRDTLECSSQCMCVHTQPTLLTLVFDLGYKKKEADKLFSPETSISYAWIEFRCKFLNKISQALRVYSREEKCPTKRTATVCCYLFP